MNKLFVFLFCVFTNFIYAQEVVSPLIYNSKLGLHPIERFASANLALPFFDDFSQHTAYPNPKLWQDNDVYVNRSLPVNPINLGVASFDGLDSLGNPRNIASETAHGPSDFLTSKFIDISEESEVYLSFYFQPQGLGNEPESNDVLLVQLLDSLDQWVTVWETSGTSLIPFEKVQIVIDDPIYFHNQFKFRFHNFSTLSGSFDHWHIDNVLLTEDLSLSNNNDDVAFVYETSDVLNFYSSIPWSHFVGNESNYMASIMDSWLRNNYNSIKSIDYRYDIFDEQGNSVYHYPTTGPSRNDNVFSFDDVNFSYSEHSSAPITLYTFSFNSTASDRASFNIIQSIATDDIDLFKNNDTLRYKQDFFNYYSLDDGTAEASYGVNVDGGKMAMRYNISETDILKAVQIHFEQNLEDASGSSFTIKIWNESGGIPNDVIYQSQIFFPEYTDIQNGFHEYVLDDPISVSGPIFVGIEQYYSQLLNVGLDKNTINNDRMYYNLGLDWNQSNCSECSGTWMIRPVFGTLSSTNTVSSKLKIYPNPSNDYLFVSSDQKVMFKLYDLNSRLIHSSSQLKSNFTIDVTTISKGVYILQLINDNSFINRKIIIQ